MNKITFSAPYLGIDGYAIPHGDETPIDAVGRSLERRTGMRAYCSRIDSHTRTCTVYQITLVHRRQVTGGGFSVYAEPRVYVDHDNSGMFR